MLTFALDAGVSALALTPTADCTTTGNVTPSSACCQSEGVGASFPFEVLLSTSGAYVLARASSSPGGALLTLQPLNASAGARIGGVRYAWQAYPLCAVTNVGGGWGLPAPPFEWAHPSF